MSFDSDTSLPSASDSASQPDQELQLSWEQNALAWTDVVRAQGIESRRLVTDEAIVQAALALTTDSQAFKVLDLGCGEGWLTRRLSAEGLNVTGCDGSAELIQQAQALSELSTENQADYLCLSYETLSLKPAQAGSDYDLMIANFALLSEDLVPLVSALRQISSKNAHLLIQTLHPFNLVNAGEPYSNGWRREDFTGFGGDHEQNTWTPMPWYFRTVSGWLQLLQDAGWLFKHLAEPVHPQTLKPLSLILTAQK